MGTFKERLDEALKDKGVTETQARADLQKITGMTRSNLTHWFGGRTKEPKGAAAAQAADYFEVLPLWLSKGLGEKRLNGKDKTVADKQKRAQLSEDARVLLSMYESMPDDLKPMARRHIRDMLEAYGPASPENPFGKGAKRRPAKKNVKPAKKKRSSGTQ